MPNVNDFLPFCATDTSTNLIEQADYLVSTARPIGNQPGIASSQLNNKALRQGTYVVGQLAQYISNLANVSVLDNAEPAQLLAQMMGTFMPLAPTLTQLLSGTSTWNATVYFFIASGNATAGATYTNNSNTFTVVNTISAGLVLQTTGSATPSTGGGTLTKTSGTGDSTITFYAFKTALYLRIRMIGGGGGGAGSGLGSAGANGSTGSVTTFGSSLLTANPGQGGDGNNGPGGTGGTVVVVSPAQALVALQGATGGEYPLSGGGTVLSGFDFGGAPGGSGPFGGAGNGSIDPGGDAIPNTGSGGQGGGNPATTGNITLGGGGGVGGYIEALIASPGFTYGYSVGTGGAGGGPGPSGAAGGAGGSGVILLEECFQ